MGRSRLAKVLFSCLLFAAAGARAETPDLSTPKKAALAFARAVEAGDMSLIKTVSVGSDQDFRFIASLSELVSAANKLEQAAVSRWGEAGKKVAKEVRPDYVGHMQESREQIEGDTAAVGRPRDPQPLKLKKIDGVWKVDLSQITGRDESADIVPKVRKVLSDVTADIQAGKFKTADQAHDAVSSRMFAAIAPDLEKSTRRPSAPVPAGDKRAPSK